MVVISEESPVGLHAGLPATDVVPSPAVVAVFVSVSDGVMTLVVVRVVTPGEAVLVTVTMTVVGLPPITVVLVDVTVSCDCEVMTGGSGVAEALGTPTISC